MAIKKTRKHNGFCFRNASRHVNYNTPAIPEGKTIVFSCFFDGQTLPSAVKNNTLGGFPGNPLFFCFFSGLFLAGPGAWGGWAWSLGSHGPWLHWFPLEIYWFTLISFRNLLIFIDFLKNVLISIDFLRKSIDFHLFLKEMYWFSLISLGNVLIFIGFLKKSIDFHWILKELYWF